MAQLVISPSAVIGFRDGRICINAGGQPDRCAVVGSADLLRWLIRFAEPTDEDDVLAETAPADRGQVAKAIDDFKAKKILIPVTTDAPATVEADRAPQDVKLVTTQLGALANVIYLVAGDLAAFGPYAAEQLASKSGVSLQSRISSLLAGAMSLQQELRELRSEYVARQLDDLEITNTTRNLKLNLGAGKRPLESWLNIDLHPAELAIDLRWGLPFGDGAADFVYLSHLLEHLYFPGEASQILQEIHRVLSPDGVVRIVVPDVEKCIRAYADDDCEFFESRKKTWKKWNATTKLEGFLHYAGVGPKPSFFLGNHKFGYDFETLEHVLREAGFHSVVRSGYMQSQHECLNVDDASKVAGAQFGEDHYSLFVEASY